VFDDKLKIALQEIKEGKEEIKSEFIRVCHPSSHVNLICVIPWANRVEGGRAPTPRHDAGRGKSYGRVQEET
jgi:hypothetical protein